MGLNKIRLVINMDTVIVIMQKNKESGFLEKELASLNISENDELIVNLFAIEEDSLKLHIKITTDKDMEDWEYSAIYDYYDPEIFGDKIESITEIEDSYNPEWELVLDYPEDLIELEDKIIDILKIHRQELNSVYEVIKDKKGDYENEK